MQNHEWTKLRDVYHATYLLRLPLVILNGYRYKPLDASRNEIRLLCRSTDLEIGTQVSYTLNHVSLDEQPEYKALSYTWRDGTGDDGLRVNIKVDGQSVRVTRNLAAALDQLFTNNNQLALWVDALCIDQRNVPERNEQVSKMKTVYQNATEVLAWLGEEYDESGNAFELLRALHRDGLEKTLFGGSEPTKSGRVATDSVVKDTHAVVKLFNRDYWQRSWVVQEVELAKSVTIHCGCDSLAWENLDNALTALSEDHVLLYYAFDTTSVGHLLWQLISVGPNLLTTSVNTKSREANTLSQTLIRHRVKKATDPRDKIYSILGILPVAIQTRVPVDYSLVPSIVFRNVATYIVTEEKDLRILAENKVLLNNHTLPSWVPNWAHTNITDKIRIDRIGYPEQEFHASGSSSIAEGYELSDCLLRVKGICVGMVTAVGPEMPDFREEEFNFVPVFDTLYEWWLLFYSAGRRDIVGNGSFLDIITYGLSYKEFAALGPGKLKEYEDKTVADVQLALSIYKPWDQTLLPVLTDPGRPITDAEKRGAENSVWSLAPSSRKRKFIVVDTKEFGYGPQGVEIGDLVVVVRGCLVPIVFRRRKDAEGGYLNIGDSFLGAYMYGKALQDVENGTRKFESFELH